MLRILAAPALVLLALAPAAEAATPRIAPVNAVSIAEGNAGTKTVKVAVSLSTPAGRKTRVKYKTVAGTAAASDFAPRSGTLKFKKGKKRATISITVKGDTVDEANETFTVRLLRPTGARLGSRRLVTVTIVDDDAPAGGGTVPGGPQPGGPGTTDPGPTPVISVADRTVTEPAGAGAKEPHGLVAQLNKPTNHAVTVDFSFVAIGSTTTSADVDLDGGSLTFAPGETAKPLTGNVKGDALDENEEKVRAVLSNAQGGDVISPDAFLTITDDPGDVPPTMSIADGAALESTGKAETMVTLSAPSGRVVTVAYATQDGTAMSGGVTPDYTAASGTLVLQPGETFKAIPVALADDSEDEQTESFTVLLSEPGGATISDTEAVVAIIDNEP